MEPLPRPLPVGLALVEGGCLIPQPLDDVLNLLLQLAHHGLDVGLHSLGDLGGQWLHLGLDGPVRQIRHRHRFGKWPRSCIVMLLTGRAPAGMGCSSLR